ncbi:hypothetical protein ACFWR6_06965 [Streptomyces griseus]|uniref:hypothetical protein n=1 Tax=Streptomyces griseus TaxID=1911 RepID=UPI003654994E
MEQQQRTIPGVRYKKVKRTRRVPFEWRGQMKMRTENFYEWVPVPPLNLDRVYLRAVIAIALGLTLVAAVWSTTAIGRLLKDMVPGHEQIGYVGALAFEIPWVGCLLVQWILRDEPERARPAVIGGWIGLAVVVGAVVIDGFDLDMPLVGAVAAFVSILAKGFWWIVLRMVHRPLDEEHAGQLDAVRQGIAVDRVLMRERSAITAHEAYLAQVYGPDAMASLPGPVAPPELTAALGQAPDVSGAVSAQVSSPAAPPPGHGPDTSGHGGVPVAPVPAPPVAPAAPTAPPTQFENPVPSVPPTAPQDPPTEPQEPPVGPVAITRPGISEVCRKEIAANTAITDAELVAAVLAAGHPKKDSLADTVRRTAQRVDPKRRAS